MLQTESNPELAAAPIRRVERKFTALPTSGQLILSWMRHVLVPDPVYPSSWVTTLYYDTGDLDAYQESAEDDLIKHKVRLRWYDTPGERGLVACSWS